MPLFALTQLPRRLYSRQSPNEKVVIFTLFKFETFPSKDAFFSFQKKLPKSRGENCLLIPLAS